MIHTNWRALSACHVRTLQKCGLVNFETGAVLYCIILAKNYSAMINNGTLGSPVIQEASKGIDSFIDIINNVEYVHVIGFKKVNEKPVPICMIKKNLAEKLTERQMPPMLNQTSF